MRGAGALALELVDAVPPTELGGPEATSNLRPGSILRSAAGAGSEVKLEGSGAGAAPRHAPGEPSGAHPGPGPVTR